MQVRSTETSPVTPEKCETAYSLAFHPVYRYFLFLQIAVLIFAVFPMCHFLWFKLRKSSFHGNLKVGKGKRVSQRIGLHWITWLLAGYFGAILGLMVDLLVLAIIQLIFQSLSTDKCDLIFGKSLYAPATISVAYFQCLPSFFPILITIERFLATKMADKYDKTPVFLGPAITIFLILLNLFIVFGFFKTETFEGGSLSLMFYPPNTAPKIYVLLWVFLFLNAINVFLSFYLLRLSARMKRINNSLSAKYQREEVYTSTVFTISIMFLQLVLYSTYISLIMFWRYFGSLVIENSVNLTAVRGAQVTMIDVSNLLIGIVAGHLYNRIREKKSMVISGTVRMEATGGAGAKNYDDAIQNIWNSHSLKPI